MDIHKSMMDIQNAITDTHNANMDIRHSIMGIHNAQSFISIFQLSISRNQQNFWKLSDAFFVFMSHR